MQGFFYDTRKQAPSREGRAKSSGPRQIVPRGPIRVGQAPDCGSCGLFRGCKSPKMTVAGKGLKRVLFIGEAPGEIADASGRPFTGKSGTLLKRRLFNLGFDLERDGWATYAINCRPPQYASPSHKQIGYCRPLPWNAIKRLRPAVIVLLGSEALETVLGHRVTKELGGIGKWRGFAFPDRELGAWVVPTFHPSFILRGQENDLADLFFKQDLELALSCLKKPWPLDGWKPAADCVEILKDPERVADILDKTLFDEPEWFAFDYETTGLKPYRTGQRIVSASFCVDPNKAYAFAWDDERADIHDLWRGILSEKRIQKIASNMKFEHTWTRAYLGYEVRGWGWDTMLAAHVHDDRPGITSIKFQGYLYTGELGWEGDVAPYLEATQAEEAQYGANAINRITEAPKDKLLLYNGIDSLIEYRAAFPQMDAIAALDLDAGYNLLHRGTLAMARAEAVGVDIDVPYLETAEKNLTAQIEAAGKALDASKLGKTWRGLYGDKTNYGSGPQGRVVFFDTLKLKPLSETEKGAPQINDAMLTKYAPKVPGISDMLRIKKLEKARDTYLAQLKREVWDGVMHPFFSLHTVQGYRSSSQNPNFQNMPSRDEEFAQLIRQAIVPPDGFQIVEFDYKGVEVCGGASVTKDRNLIAYVTDPKKDMHRDSAMDMFMLPASEVTKPARHVAKNKFVFPQFYGDYYVSCAEAIWEVLPKLSTASGAPLLEHLEEKGVTSYTKFENRIKAAEQIFWGTRFKQYDAWRDQTYEDYLEKGYLRTVTGFRCSGLLRKNQTSNRPIQGPSFHILLWSLIETDKWLRTSGKKSRIFGQIHDSMLMYIWPPERDEIITKVLEISTKRVREHWAWIIVPLIVEIEIAPVNGSWFEKKPWKQSP